MPPADDPVEGAVRSFAATLIAEAAHELNNRLATMRETVGLLEDLARAGRSGASRTDRAHATLDDQVGRALNTVRMLGSLAGGLSPATGGFDAGAAVDALVALNAPRARRRSLQIEREVAGGLPAAAGDPALFLCLVHRLLERCAAPLRAGGSVAVRVGPAGDGTAVHLVPSGDREAGRLPSEAGDDEINLELARRLGGQLLFEAGGAASVRLPAIR